MYKFSKPNTVYTNDYQCGAYTPVGSNLEMSLNGGFVRISKNDSGEKSQF